MLWLATAEELQVWHQHHRHHHHHHHHYYDQQTGAREAGSHQNRGGEDRVRVSYKCSDVDIFRFVYDSIYMNVDDDNLPS